MGVVGSSHIEHPASSLREQASALLDVADREPESVAERAHVVVAACDGASHASLVTASIAWRALGIAQRVIGRITEALTALDAAVDTADRSGDLALAGLARTSRAAPRFITGDMEGGLADLGFALEHLEGADRGIAMFQHAQYLDVIEDSAATAEFDRAIDLLSRAPTHAKYEAHALANRGLHLARLGRLDAAEHDLAAALAIWDALGLESLAATVVHNLGAIAHLRGDFVTALDRFESAQRRSTTLGHEHGDSGRDYCDALLDVGLAAEAYERAAELALETAAGGDELTAAELRLLAAHAALQLGDEPATVEMATAALAQFDAAGRPGWAAQARLALARAAVGLGNVDVDELDRLADDLEGRGWDNAALHARLLAVDVVAAAGRHRAAAARLTVLTGALRTARPVRRLHALAAEAALAVAAGDSKGATGAVRRGLVLVEREQRSVGAPDARAHFASHATHLLDVGRRVAVAHDDARVAWAQLERMRALSLRQRSVRPVDDDELGALLATLRQITLDRTAIEPGSATWLSTGREQRRLERLVADHVRRTPGADGGAAARVDLDTVAALLAGGTMLTFDVVAGRLWTFTFDGRMRRTDCGPVAQFSDRVAAAQLAARRLARRTTNAHSVALAASQLVELGSWFDEHLPVRAATRGHEAPIVLVIPNELAQVPWGLVTSLANRPFSLAPSAWSWLSAMQRSPTSSGRAVFAAGPGLPAAADEVTASSGAFPGAIVLTGAAATTAAVGAAIDDAPLAHVAAHYAPRRGNPLFSAFELADGPWFLHDVARCEAMPPTWVVPSCESSVGDAPVAGELLGLTSVLLGAGARSVVMSSGLVPDDEVTATTMLSLHLAMSAGDGPAVALARSLATAGESPAATVLRATLACHGAW